MSPYSFLGFETLCRYKSLWNLDLQLRPIFLGGIMNATGNKPPATLPARGAYMFKDIQRNARYFEIPLKLPPNFPSNTIKAMRILTAMKEQFPDMLENASRAFFRLYWVEGQDITNMEVVSRALEAIGCNSEECEKLVQQTEDSSIKEKLKAATEEAVARGSFGAPTMFVKRAGQENLEMFFGSDRFPHIAIHIGEQFHGPVPHRSRL